MVFTFVNCWGNVQTPSVYHPMLIIFLEYFSWGLLFDDILDLFIKVYGNNSFLMNGIIQGIKGFLSFLSAPLIGAISDYYGRKTLLFLTVLFTCFPIPFMIQHPRIFFALTAFSGVMSVTFTIVFAYVSDCIPEEKRVQSNGLVSATFAASLILSPGIGNVIRIYTDVPTLVIVATLVALLDLVFIWFCVPESLQVDDDSSPTESRITFIRTRFSSFDPFSTLRYAIKDKNLTILSAMIVLSYIPEAGQSTCIFLYLKNAAAFKSIQVVFYVAFVGTLSAISQTIVLSLLFRRIGQKNTFRLSIVFQIIQLLIYAVSTREWIIWTAGIFVALSTMAYPCISTILSLNSDASQQGFVQGMVTGYRAVCTGIGPLVFGSLFYAAGIEMQDHKEVTNSSDIKPITASPRITYFVGFPFLFGALCSTLCLVLTYFFRFENIIGDPRTVNFQTSDNNTNHDDFQSSGPIQNFNITITNNPVSDECEQTVNNHPHCHLEGAKECNLCVITNFPTS